MSIAVVQYGQGGPDVLRVEDYEPGDPAFGQVALRQEAIGVNYLDIVQRNGFLPMQRPSMIAGVEGAGVVIAVGPGVSGFEVGDRVAYLRSQGAYASERLIEASELLRLPADVGFDQAAALIVKGFWAWLLLRRVFEVKAGDTLLVTTAAGGIGSLVVRLATFLGARVIGVVGSASKKGAAFENGAAEVAVGLEEALPIIDRLTAGRGVDAVLDGIGAGVAETLVGGNAVRAGGTVISFGSAGGWPTADARTLHQKGIHFVAPVRTQYVNTTKDLQVVMDDVFALLRRGGFGSSLPVTPYRLVEAAKLHADIEERRVTGIAVLVP